MSWPIPRPPAGTSTRWFRSLTSSRSPDRSSDPRVAGGADAGSRVRRRADRDAHRGSCPRRLQGAHAAGKPQARGGEVCRTRGVRGSRSARSDPSRPARHASGRRYELGASAVAAAWGGPWGQWFPYPLPVPSRDVPPFGPGLRPAAGRLGRLRDRALRPVMLSSMAKVFLPSVNVARGSVGEAPFASIHDMFTAAPLLLYMTAEPFEYPRSDWPACVRMVGPCCWDPPAEPPPWMAGIEQPIVLVSTSSEFQDDARLVTTALEALANEDVHSSRPSPPPGSPSPGCLPTPTSSSSCPTPRSSGRRRARSPTAVPESPRGISRGSAGVRRAVRPRSARGRPPRRGRRRGLDSQHDASTLAGYERRSARR